MNKPGTKEQKVNKIYAKISARQNLSCKALYLLHKFTDELSVSREYVKKRANISREVKSLKWMHKTPSKTKRKKSTHINTRKKVHPTLKKVLAIIFNLWA